MAFSSLTSTPDNVLQYAHAAAYSHIAVGLTLSGNGCANAAMQFPALISAGCDVELVLC